MTGVGCPLQVLTIEALDEEALKPLCLFPKAEERMC
jgi:hypothetical protein